MHLRSTHMRGFVKKEKHKRRQREAESGLCRVTRHVRESLTYDMGRNRSLDVYLDVVLAGVRGSHAGKGLLLAAVQRLGLRPEVGHEFFPGLPPS